MTDRQSKVSPSDAILLGVLAIATVVWFFRGTSQDEEDSEEQTVLGMPVLAGVVAMCSQANRSPQGRTERRRKGWNQASKGDSQQ